MKRFFEKIKNWLKTEKVVKRSTLILLCLSVFACGILYTFLVTSDTCNNESDIENVSLTSNTETNIDTYYVDDTEMDNVEYVDVDENDMVFDYSEFDFNIDTYTKVMTYGFRPILKPEITQYQLDNIKSTIKNYANDYYKPYDNLLYLKDSNYFL